MRPAAADPQRVADLARRGRRAPTWPLSQARRSSGGKPDRPGRGSRLDGRRSARADGPGRRPSGRRSRGALSHGVGPRPARSGRVRLPIRVPASAGRPIRNSRPVIRRPPAGWTSSSTQVSGRRRQPQLRWRAELADHAWPRADRGTASARQTVSRPNVRFDDSCPATAGRRGPGVRARRRPESDRADRPRAGADGSASPPRRPAGVACERAGEPAAERARGRARRRPGGPLLRARAPSRSRRAASSSTRHDRPGVEPGVHPDERSRRSSGRRPGSSAGIGDAPRCRGRSDGWTLRIPCARQVEDRPSGRSVRSRRGRPRSGRSSAISPIAASSRIRAGLEQRQAERSRPERRRASASDACRGPPADPAPRRPRPARPPGAATSASRIGTANRPLPKKTVRAGSSSGAHRRPAARFRRARPGPRGCARAPRRPRRRR